jgi:hypothetical protein
MNAKNTSVRLVFAVASVLSTAVTLGSILALADHYNKTSQWASARAVVVAQQSYGGLRSNGSGKFTK